jgi:hypothetical protein
VLSVDVVNCTMAEVTLDYDLHATSLGTGSAFAVAKLHEAVIQNGSPHSVVSYRLRSSRNGIAVINGSQLTHD